jgi:hypothetical protein
VVVWKRQGVCIAYPALKLLELTAALIGKARHENLHSVYIDAFAWIFKIQIYPGSQFPIL